MKLKYLTGITLLITLLLLCTGLYYKSTCYKDYNLEEHPLRHFNVALLTEDFLSFILEDAESTLNQSNLVLAVTSEEASTFRFSCTTEKVSVAKVFKGTAVKEGDVIEIVREGSHIFLDEEIQTDGRPAINLGFVNEMQVGKTYLVFLDCEVTDQLGRPTGIYMPREDFLFAPIFCYEALPSIPYDSIDDLGKEIDYVSVEDSEFFLNSQGAVDKMTAFKNKLLEEYALDAH